MKKRILIAIFSMVLFSGVTVWANEEKSANFDRGAVGSDGYESLSFYVHEDGAREIVLYRGKNWDSFELKYLGVNKKGNGSFDVELPSGEIWKVTPKGPILTVETKRGSEKFKWAYEGPVDGRGTFCASCVEESDAVPFVVDQFAH